MGYLFSSASDVWLTAAREMRGPARIGKRQEKYRSSAAGGEHGYRKSIVTQCRAGRALFGGCDMAAFGTGRLPLSREAAGAQR